MNILVGSLRFALITKKKFGQQFGNMTDQELAKWLEERLAENLTIDEWQRQSLEQLLKELKK